MQHFCGTEIFPRASGSQIMRKVTGCARGDRLDRANENNHRGNKNHAERSLKYGGKESGEGEGRKKEKKSFRAREPAMESHAVRVR